MADLATARRRAETWLAEHDGAAWCADVVPIVRSLLAATEPPPAADAAAEAVCNNCGGNRTCERCGGSGGGPDLPHRCTSCDGTGRCYLCAPALAARGGG